MTKECLGLEFLKCRLTVGDEVAGNTWFGCIGKVGPKHSVVHRDKRPRHLWNSNHHFAITCCPRCCPQRMTERDIRIELKDVLIIVVTEGSDEPE